MVAIDEFAVFPMLYILVSFGNNVDIDLHYDNNPFWIYAECMLTPIRMTLNDLECTIHLRVRLRTARLAYVYVVAFGHHA